MAHAASNFVGPVRWLAFARRGRCTTAFGSGYDLEYVCDSGRGVSDESGPPLLRFSRLPQMPRAPGRRDWLSRVFAVSGCRSKGSRGGAIGSRHKVGDLLPAQPPSLGRKLYLSLL